MVGISWSSNQWEKLPFSPPLKSIFGVSAASGERSWATATNLNLVLDLAEVKRLEEGERELEGGRRSEAECG